MPQRLVGSRLDSALQTIKDIAKRYSDEGIVRESQWLADRAHAEELTVLIAGQFKRGKSTFINALLGEDLLPTGVLPLTSVATMIHYGPERRGLVSFRDGNTMQVDPADIGRYVTEAENPENRLRVSRVDVEVPLPLLEGIRLVDTPGIASTFVHNTEAARAALREADLAILIVAPDPPVGEAEISFTKELRKASERFFVVYNKADVLADQERVLVDFTKAQLEDALGFAPKLFVLSAREALHALKAGRDDRRFSEFLREFRNFIDAHRDVIRERSLTRKFLALSKRLETTLRLRRHALLLPAQERRTARKRFEQLSGEVRRRAGELPVQIEHAMRSATTRIDECLAERVRLSHAILTKHLLPCADDGDLAAFEREAEMGAAREAASWWDDVWQIIDEQMREQAEVLLGRVGELENEILKRGLDVVQLQEAIPHAVPEAFDLPGISLPKERIADTGLEIVAKSGMALLPRPLRARALRARLDEAVRERLDRRHGRLRYAAHQELERIAKVLVSAAQRRLVAAEAAVRNALDDAADVDDEGVHLRVADLERDELIVERLTTGLFADAQAET